MLTIHARNMMRSAFMRSQLEASKIRQKVTKKSKKPFSTAVKPIPFKPVLNGWVQKMHAEEEKKVKGKRKEKKKRKEEKCFFFFFFFFYKSMRLFFHICAVVIFQIYKETIS